MAANSKPTSQSQDEALLPCLACGEPSPEGMEYCDAKCEIDALRQENTRVKAEREAALAAAAGRAAAAQVVTVRRSKADGATQGNALSVYGLGRWPITLYREQWEKLLSDPVVAEIKRHLPSLPRKSAPVASAQPTQQQQVIRQNRPNGSAANAPGGRF